MVLVKHSACTWWQGPHAVKVADEGKMKSFEVTTEYTTRVDISSLDAYIRCASPEQIPGGLVALQCSSKAGACVAEPVPVWQTTAQPYLEDR